jgi:Fe-S-cluster-containing dehydrogenase component
MTDVSRRDALRFLAGGGLAAATVAEAHEAGRAPVGVAVPEPMPEAVGLLYDATRCIGCKACVGACAKANDLMPDTGESEGRWQMPEDLNCQTKNIIKLYDDPEKHEQSFVKQQCMHCLDPSCVAACPFGALGKDAESGIVSWEGDRCVGCRYCEVACPYEVPKFEWKKVNPRIVKCELCAHRLKDGGQPACTEVCPTSAVIFGPREKLLADAKSRIAVSPGKYFENRVYGEKEGGGTQVLYLSAVNFERIGLPALTQTSGAHYGTRVHGVIYKYMSGPLLLLGGMVTFIRKHWKSHVTHVEHDQKESGDDAQF